jgi:hypothetical protein
MQSTALMQMNTNYLLSLENENTSDQSLLMEQCIFAPPLNQEHAYYMEQKILQIYEKIMEEKKRIPFFYEISECVSTFNELKLEKCAEIDFKNNDFEFIDTKGYCEEEIFDQLMDSHRDNFYYNYSYGGNEDLLVASMLNKHHMAYFVEADEPLCDILNLSEAINFSGDTKNIDNKDECQIVINDCQNILFFQMATDGTTNDDSYINIPNIEFFISRHLEVHQDVLSISSPV